MILAMDAGNTNLEIGLIPDEKGKCEIINSVRFYTKSQTTLDELGFFIINFLNFNKIDFHDIKAVIFSSVVPQLTNTIVKMCEKYFSGTILEVTSKLDLGIVNDYKHPEEVGADRLVNASYIYHKYRKNAVIVDMGTATTLCVLTADGRYKGGVIVPGIQTSQKALVTNAAKLPAFRIVRPEKILSDTTTEALESGLYFSNFYALKGMLARLAEESGFSDYITVATGGYAEIFFNNGLFDYFEGDLALRGLKVIADRNRMCNEVK